MAASSTVGTRGQLQFSALEAPDMGADETALSDQCAAVGTRRVGTTAERNALSGPKLFVGLRWGDTTVKAEYEYTAAGWAPASTNVAQRLGDVVSVGPMITQAGIARVRGSGGTYTSQTITFPRAFSGTPVVVAGLMGYRATGAFSPSSLNLAGEQSNAQTVTSLSFLAYLTSPTTLDAAFDFYVSWIAVGPA